MMIHTTVKGHAMSTTAKVPPAKLARVVERIRHHLYRLNQRLTPAPAAMIEMILAGWTSQAITVAAQLGVADALADGPLPIDELAVRVEADADALRRLLRALISRGIFRERRDGRYELNSLSDTLRSDAPVSMKSAARFYGSQEQRERWTLLVDSIRTGNAVVESLRGKESFDYFAENPERAEPVAGAGCRRPRCHRRGVVFRRRSRRWRRLCPQEHHSRLERREGRADP